MHKMGEEVNKIQKRLLCFLETDSVWKLTLAAEEA